MFRFSIALTVNHARFTFNFLTQSTKSHGNTQHSRSPWVSCAHNISMFKVNALIMLSSTSSAECSRRWGTVAFAVHGNFSSKWKKQSEVVMTVQLSEDEPETLKCVTNDLLNGLRVVNCHRKLNQFYLIDFIAVGVIGFLPVSFDLCERCNSFMPSSCVEHQTIICNTWRVNKLQSIFKELLFKRWEKIGVQINLNIDVNFSEN